MKLIMFCSSPEVGCPTNTTTHPELHHTPSPAPALTVYADGVDHVLELLGGRLDVVLGEDGPQVVFGQHAVRRVALEEADEAAILARVQVVQRLQQRSSCYSFRASFQKRQSVIVTRSSGSRDTGPGADGTEATKETERHERASWSQRASQ